MTSHNSTMDGMQCEYHCEMIESINAVELDHAKLEKDIEWIKSHLEKQSKFLLYFTIFALTQTASVIFYLATHRGL